jgi:hypothetical protein
MVIVSSYHGATNTRGAKIKVKSHEYPAKFYSYNYAVSEYENRVDAVDHYVFHVLNEKTANVLTIGWLDKNAVIHGVA